MVNSASAASLAVYSPAQLSKLLLLASTLATVEKKEGNNKNKGSSSWVLGQRWDGAAQRRHGSLRSPPR